MAAAPSLTQNGYGTKIWAGKELRHSAITHSTWLRGEDLGWKKLCHSAITHSKWLTHLSHFDFSEKYF
jgi:hypothetical protein